MATKHRNKTPNMSSATPQPSKTPAAIVGCLLDVSGSMREALETGKRDERATERLRAVLRAALKLARAEERRHSSALMFIGAFGLQREENSVVDLCRLVEALLGGTSDPGDFRNGHEHLIALANENNVPHITQYITTKLTQEEARIVHAYLQRHTSRIQGFVDAIPSPKDVADMEEKFAISKAAAAGASFGTVSVTGAGVCFAAFGCIVGTAGVDYAKDKAIGHSKALQLARLICDEWLLDFKELKPRPVSEIVPLLERIQDHLLFEQNTLDHNLLDDLRPHLYGRTPMRLALGEALSVFCAHPAIKERVLVIITDGNSTDGNPLQCADELEQEGVTIAAVYLTADTVISPRRLYDCSKSLQNSGQRTLFRMASKIAAVQHPVPVLAAMGWNIPSSGECALYASVCTSSALEEFCSLLLSARFGSMDVLLDIIGRVNLDAYIDDVQMRTQNHPSNQGESRTCYAHATAAVIHMALARIVGREGGYPSIKDIRTKILQNLPPGRNGRDMLEVMRKAEEWYRPVKFEKIDEKSARQAILNRRPVLTMFRLSKPDWKAFGEHFEAKETRNSVLTKATMASYHNLDKDDDENGHAVVLVKCAPNSLTFLNSWGHAWGDNGSFSIEDQMVLESSSAPKGAPMCFYNVCWYEPDLTAGERQAYAAKVDEEVRARAAKHPSVLELEMQCPKCKGNAPIADVTGSIRKAVCPLCRQTFKPEPGHLVQAIYAKAGLGDVV